MDEEPLQITLGCPDGIDLRAVFAALGDAGFRVDGQDPASRVWILERARPQG